MDGQRQRLMLQTLAAEGQSIFWTWKDSEEQHNILHVQPGEDGSPQTVVQGALAFNSGKAVANNNFLYTFLSEGVFSVTSHGSPGKLGTIRVLDKGVRTTEPRITHGGNGGLVRIPHIVLITSETPGVKIYYTTDAACPEVCNPAIRVYHEEHGIGLETPMLAFIRAMAVSQSLRDSRMFVCRCYHVITDVPSLTQEEIDKKMALDMLEKKSENGETPPNNQADVQSRYHEVFWDNIKRKHLPQIKGYKFFMNNFSYTPLLPNTYTSLNVSGMAGGRNYQMQLIVYPVNSDYYNVESNMLGMGTPVETEGGGPVISVEVGDVTTTLVIVWSTQSLQHLGYIVYLNKAPIGDKLASEKCK
ncbi:PREDICTED: uncharacterized protein LOC106810622 [Priapulus caudatus]|uniref:Uncharacterized protein LOC106810622 n=1 Tax=Priapulus caudatus TaxID=37621 RepID=A0ABM1EBG1_PRICU|nr:PREDICTED: uncharacterized protein LOC106810622 [Priapulus caudatus]